jgi:hypothetical protein
MKTFLKAIQAESLKVRRNPMFIMLCCMPVIGNLIMTIYFSFYKDVSTRDLWILFTQDSSVFYTALYPALIALVGFVYVDLEIKNNCNKQLFYLPIKPYKIYFAKCAILLIYYTISVLIAYLSLRISLKAVDAIAPTTLLNSMFLKTYLIFLPLVFFQYTLSLFISKVWLPCTLAFFLYVGGFLGYNSNYSYLLPNASFIKMIFTELPSKNIEPFNQVSAISLLYTLLFFIVGYFAFTKSKYKIDS